VAIQDNAAMPDDAPFRPAFSKIVDVPYMGDASWDILIPRPKRKRGRYGNIDLHTTLPLPRRHGRFRGCQFLSGFIVEALKTFASIRDTGGQAVVRNEAEFENFFRRAAEESDESVR
jgi:hypothetical protein